MAGELHGQESDAVCKENHLVYQTHIAGWKLNEQHNIFSVSLFASGHSMRCGYAMEESYDHWNWMIEVLDKETLQVRVSKTRDRIVYSVSITFKAL